MAERTLRLKEDGPHAYRGAGVHIRGDEVLRVEDGDVAEHLLATGYLEEVDEDDLEMAGTEREETEGRAEGTLTTDDLETDRDTDTGAEEAVAEETETGSVESQSPEADVSGETETGYARDELESMSRSQLQQLASDADTDEIDGRSSNTDIIDTLAEDGGE